MENLLALVDKIQRVSPLPVFTNETIVVQNPGMQHWLNLSLANIRGVSMNYDYALPSQFLWKLLRTMASKEKVPEQSPYSREVLCWRIYRLLQSPDVINSPSFSMPTHYWLGQSTATSEDFSATPFSSQALLKCYQLAVQLADLFEQYLIFRPNWVHQWNQNNFADDTLSEDATQHFVWQGKLWAMLTQKYPYDPIALIQSAVENMGSLKVLLPPRIFFFGINSMPPIWLDFVHKLSEHIDIHFFHLNPCYAYWGDLLTEKQAAKTLNAWCEGVEDISHDVGNPLLANLGQQGREFMAMLQRYSTIDIDVFEDTPSEPSLSVAENLSDEQLVSHKHDLKSSQPTHSVLKAIQADILHLQDKRTAPVSHIDNSIVVTSAHSALREVQGLHDWLLHQFNEDPQLSPKDVLVMCPHVEDYAPYVNAVFSYGWQKVPDSTPPLPCSIADRVSKDSEPLVAAFSRLIALPDSRFKVSELIGYLRLPTLQQKFELTNAQIDTLSLWIESASIHWGLNAEHKAEMLAQDGDGEKLPSSHAYSADFTWEYGLNKLLKGFAFSESREIYNNELLLPHVEGANSVLLGQLMLIIEQLQYFSQTLKKSRSAADWQAYLLSLVEQFFGQSDDAGLDIIHQAVESLATHCSEAAYSDNIDWLIVCEYLNHHFSQPDPGRQFMVGQVTFCSMLPMRSIPFKVIAILGLNDGDYPRQRQAQGFDLLGLTPCELGDRSRRGDDRYLFLEAIISARQSLYLSYQGRSIKNNTEKQPSIVLEELLQYLQLGYGWSFHTTNNEADTHSTKNNEVTEDAPEPFESNSCDAKGSQLRELPMQPFSLHNYQGTWPSFDGKWLSLLLASSSVESTNLQESVNSLSDISTAEEDIIISIDELIRFFQHPAKYFAQQRLSLYLDINNQVLDDTEPFSTNSLETYLLRQDLLAAHIAHKCSNDSPEALTASIAEVIQVAKLSGKFPDLPSTTQALNDWAQDSENFSEYISEDTSVDITPVSVVIPLQLRATNVKISVTFPVANDKLVFFRSSGAKWKDYFSLYCYQLLLLLWKQQYAARDTALPINDDDKLLCQVSATHGYYFDAKAQKNMQCTYQFSAPEHTNHIQVLLEYYVQGLSQPLLLNGEISEKAFKAKSFTQADFELLWQDPNSFAPLGADPYIAYFWKTCPEFSLLSDDLHSLYHACFTLREVVK